MTLRSRAFRALVPALLAAAALPARAQDDGVQFRDPLDNQPLEVPDQGVSEGVRQFQATGENPYTGDPAAAAEGKALYTRWCQACHLPDGTGRIGPSLVDGQSRYPRMNTDVGFFEIIYAGGAGAMQAFGERLSQDEILKVIAYLHELRAQQAS